DRALLADLLLRLQHPREHLRGPLVVRVAGNELAQELLGAGPLLRQRVGLDPRDLDLLAVRLACEEPEVDLVGLTEQVARLWIRLLSLQLDSAFEVIDRDLVATQGVGGSPGFAMGAGVL